MDRWVGLIGDASGATVVAVRSTTAGPAAIAWRSLEWDAGGPAEATAAELAAFVREHELRRCSARLLFTGAGTVVQKLRLPRMKPRDRLAAVRTRLVSYAGGRPLLVGARSEPRPAEDGALPTLVAGVDRTLCRALIRSCRAAGLRAPDVGVVAAALGASTPTGPSVQLVITERTTTMQVFEDGQLLACRDVLIGRRDFLAAYQRPILTAAGPVTLRPDQAVALVARIGVPTEAVGELAPGISSTQIWPLLNPILQRVRQEVVQTLTQCGRPPGPQTAVRVLGWPRLLGLAEYLVAEIQLRLAGDAPRSADETFLNALRPPGTTAGELDLRPPEERFVAAAWRPAIAAGLAAALVLAANLDAPRQAAAAAQTLLPVTQRLDAELAAAQQQRAALEQRIAGAARDLGRARALARAIPPQWPVLPLLKATFGETPSLVALARTELRAAPAGLELSLRGHYRGSAPASVVAEAWARAVAASAAGLHADVLSVGGSGRDEPAAIDLRVNLNPPPAALPDALTKPE